MEVNQKELAKILGVTSRRVRQLRELGFFTLTENEKKYKLEICVQEYIEYKVKEEAGGGTFLNKEKEQAEHEKIKKEISKLKLRRLRRELHEAKYVELFLTEMLVNFKNSLLSIPSKIAVKIQGEEDINKIVELLREAMWEAIEELIEYDPNKIDKETTLEEEEEEKQEVGD